MRQYWDRRFEVVYNIESTEITTEQEIQAWSHVNPIVLFPPPDLHCKRRSDFWAIRSKFCSMLFNFSDENNNY